METINSKGIIRRGRLKKLITYSYNAIMDDLEVKPKTKIIDPGTQVFSQRDLQTLLKYLLEKDSDYWRSFDKIIIYYDNGQKSLKRILNILFNSLFSNVEVRKVSPVDYKLFQVADLVCTLDHIKSKIEIGQFSKSEAEFFSSRHEFKKNYWRKLEKQRM